MASSYDNCPKCGFSFVGDPIPPEMEENFGKGNWRKEIGISDRWKDRVVAWQCPNCGHEWPTKREAGQ